MSTSDGPRDTGEAVEHLNDYYQHLATLSAGAIVVVGALAGDFMSGAGAASSTSTLGSTLAVLAMASLGLCVLLSTGMMWSYGAARRQAAHELAGPAADRWAYEVSATSLSRAKRFVRFGSTGAPLSFITGFVLLAAYAALLFI